MRIIPDNEIVVVAKHYQGKVESIVNSCAKEIIRRIRFYARLEDYNHNQTLNNLIDGYLQVLVCYESPDIVRINDFYKRLNDKSSYFIRIVELFIQYGHRHLLLNLSAFDIPEDISSRVINEAALAASIEGVTLQEASPNLSISKSSLGLLQLFLTGEDIDSKELDELECPKEYKAATNHLFYQYFFNTLVSKLSNADVIEKPYLADPTNIEEFIKNVWLTFQYTSSIIAEKLNTGDKFELSALYNSFNILKLPVQYRLGYQLHPLLSNIRKSLSKIAIHLNILCNSIDEFSMLNEDEFSEITESFWWDSRTFFNVATQNAIFNFPENIKSQVFHNLFEDERQRRDNTATLAIDSLELGILASKYGLHDKTSQFIERAALNIIGYGHRKDITLHEVFVAIEECSNLNCPQVTDWLRRVATFTTDVFTFSEKEIRHIPEWFIKLLSTHDPVRLVDELDYNLLEENWDQAGVVLENIIKVFPLSTPSEHSFLRCMTTFTTLKALKEKAEAEDNSILNSIYEEQCKILGGMPPPPKNQYSAEDEESTEAPDVSTIQPNNLDKLKFTLLSVSYEIREQFIRDWIAHWLGQEKGTTILDSFNAHYEHQNSDRELDRYLHAIFLLSKRIQGKTKAYVWAVRDITLNNCWYPYIHSRAKESIRLYGSTYKNKWEKLLRDTISSGSSWLQRDETIIVHPPQLVTYLISADRVDLAVKITEAMVSSLEGDIAHLPLTKLYWYEQPISKELAPLHLILIHFKWPDRYARLQTAKQISTLLQDSTNTEFRSLYLQYLSKQQYEVDIVDYLSILTLLENSPFNKDEIMQNIHFPSLVSDKLLLNLGYMDEKRDNFATLYSEFSDDLTPKEAKYNRYAHGLATGYIMGIEKLEKVFKVPLVKHYLLEWEKIQERHSCNIFNPYDFYGNQFYSDEKIVCSFSWPAEASILSAYIRTLAYAIGEHSIPAEEVLMYALEVLPFGSVGINLTPSDPPTSWPRLEDLMIGEPLPGQNELEKYLSQIADSDEILLHANGPILRNHSGVCLDLRVILVSLQDAGINNPQSIFHSIDHSRYTKEGIFPLAKRTWPPSFGRWEVDWPSRGYFHPTYSFGDSTENSVIPSESSVEFLCGSVCNGVWKYWINQWYPVHRVEVGNSFGTYITVSKDLFSEIKEYHGKNYHLIAEMTCVDRRDLMNDKISTKTFAMLAI